MRMKKEARVLRRLHAMESRLYSNRFLMKLSEDLPFMIILHSMGKVESGAKCCFQFLI